MNKHHREEHDMKSHHKEKRRKMYEGGEMVGEKVKKTDGYMNKGWGSVNAMVTGKHPTTNLATIECGGRDAEYKAGMGVEKGRKRMAAGGVGKIRHEAYD